jgi:Na+/proline symporter
MLVLIALITFFALLLLLAAGIPGKKHRKPAIFLTVLWGAFLAYEWYMDFIWEKSVHGPIRVDLLVLVPVIIVATLVVAIRCLSQRSTQDQ